MSKIGFLFIILSINLFSIEENQNDLIYWNYELLESSRESNYFNNAEKAFQDKKLANSLESFRNFVVLNADHFNLSHAHIRIGLISEMLGLPNNNIITAYQKALEHAQSKKQAIEARLRVLEYNSRNQNNFNDLHKKLNKIHPAANSNLMELKWLVRSKILLKEKRYQDLRNYMNALLKNKLKNEKKFKEISIASRMKAKSSQKNL